MSTEKPDVPHADLRVMCPVKKKLANVGVDVNIFRDRNLFTGCTHLDKGEVCNHDCLMTKEAHDVLTHIITAEQLEHKVVLGEIGQNVVG